MLQTPRNMATLGTAKLVANRRDFLKLSGLVAGTALLTSAPFGLRTGVVAVPGKAITV